MERLKIKCLPAFPEELKSVVLPIVEKYKDVLPAWLDTYYINLSNENDNVVASTNVNHSGRDATLFIHLALLEQDQQDREKAILHEMCHALLQPLCSAIRNIYMPNGGSWSPAIIDAIEQSVQDTTLAILRVFDKGSDGGNNNV